MANLSTSEEQLLEKIFQMKRGYVLDFSDRTMEEFFCKDIGVDIYDEKYNYASGSKANRMRGFWQVADNRLVGQSIIKLIEYIENHILLGNLSRSSFPQNLVNKGKEIGKRLLDRRVEADNFTEDDFLRRQFEEISVDSLELKDIAIKTVIQQRLDEIQKCLHSSPLATIFLCGSTLEGILLGISRKSQKEFNEAKSAPKDNSNKVLSQKEWTLGTLIDVSKELGFIDEDVKKFSHALRDFRNYIHPYEQASRSFHPTEHTAQICYKVLQMAIHQISKRINK